MKNLLTLCLAVIALSFFASCNSSGRKLTKRKGCKGKGSWYGKRNVSNFKNLDKEATYVFTTDTKENSL
jgi:hypothetical protein